MAKIQSRLGALPEHYEKLGLKKGEVALWEDGTRTNAGEKGTYEWWYFDSHLDDGTSLVIVFYTKSMMAPQTAPDPQVTFRLNTPGEAEYSQVYRPAKGETFSASKESCDVRIGPCYFRGNLHEYEIYYRDETTEARVTLRGDVPPWRPETGHIFFGKNDEHYFAWLPPVPDGTVTVELTRNGKTVRKTGTGYHDHNWGNINMRKVLHHWYWGRARAGDYRVITSYIWAEKKYGYNEFPIFMIAKDSRIVADNGAKMRFIPNRQFIETETRKPVYDFLVYDYHDNGNHYRVSYKREKSILNFPMLNDVHGILRFLARLSGFDGAYHRFTGDVIVERMKDGKNAGKPGGKTTEKIESPALWELMYFGKTI